MRAKFWFTAPADAADIRAQNHPGHAPAQRPWLTIDARLHSIRSPHSKEKVSWLKPSSSRPCGHRSASATAGCRACTRPNCPRRCSTAWSSGPASTRRIVDDVIWGCVMQAGEQALDIGRTALLAAGWPESVPGVTVDRQCGSSQQSIHFAAAGVVAGHYDVVVAGGVESMSRTPMGASLANGGHPYPEAFRDRYSQTPNQGIGAEMIAEQWGFDRTALDEFSLGSHEKAAAAQDSGAFDDQIVAHQGPGRQRGAQGRGHPPRHHHREDGHAQAGVQGGRRDPRRQLLADLRRLGRAAVHVGREGEVVGAQADLPRCTPRRWPAPTR